MDTSTERKRIPVMFSSTEKELFDSLRLSKPFSKFVKDTFYDKIDEVKQNQKNLSNNQLINKNQKEMNL